MVAPSFTKARIISTDLVDSTLFFPFHFYPLLSWTVVIAKYVNKITHRGVFNDPELGAVVYYHYVDTDIGYADGQKLFGWNALNWTDGWPSV